MKEGTKLTKDNFVKPHDIIMDHSQETTQLLLAVDAEERDQILKNQDVFEFVFEHIIKQWGWVDDLWKKKLLEYIEDAEKWKEISDPLSNRALSVIKNLSGEAGKNFKIKERLKKRIEELKDNLGSFNDFDYQDLRKELQKILQE